MKSSDFTPFFFQAGLWITGHEPGVREIMGLVLGPWATRLDGEPVVMPPAPEMPSNIPRVVIASRDRQWKLQISLVRFDLFWELKTDNARMEGEGFTEAAINTIEPFLQLSNELAVTRLAYVVRRYAPTEEPGQHLARYFCRDELLSGPLNRPSNFELHAHKVFRPQGAPEVNSWVRWKVGSRSERDRENPCVVVEQDLNTLPSEGVRFSYDDVTEFYGALHKEADEILQVYLPEGGP